MERPDLDIQIAQFARQGLACVDVADQVVAVERHHARKRTLGRRRDPDHGHRRRRVAFGAAKKRKPVTGKDADQPDRIRRALDRQWIRPPVQIGQTNRLLDVGVNHFDLDFRSPVGDQVGNLGRIFDPTELDEELHKTRTEHIQSAARLRIRKEAKRLRLTAGKHIEQSERHPRIDFGVRVGPPRGDVGIEQVVGHFEPNVAVQRAGLNHERIHLGLRLPLIEP